MLAVNILMSPYSEAMTKGASVDDAVLSFFLRAGRRVTIATSLLYYEVVAAVSREFREEFVRSMSSWMDFVHGKTFHDDRPPHTTAFELKVEKPNMCEFCPISR